MNLGFQLSPTASGSLAIDLSFAQLNDTRLTLTPLPQQGRDGADGAIEVIAPAAAQAALPRLNWAGRGVDFGLGGGGKTT